MAFKPEVSDDRVRMLVIVYRVCMKGGGQNTCCCWKRKSMIDTLKEQRNRSVYYSD